MVKVIKLGILNTQIVRPNAEIIPLKLEQIEIASSENQILSVYPSPAYNAFTVEYTLIQESEVQIVIYDIYGKQIHINESGNAVSGINQILYRNLQLKSGMYQLGLMVDGKLQDMEKLIIQ